MCIYMYNHAVLHTEGEVPWNSFKFPPLALLTSAFFPSCVTAGAPPVVALEAMILYETLSVFHDD